MSDRLALRSARVAIALALLLCAGSVTAQSARESLAVRIDSLAAEYERQHAIVSRLDSLAAANAAQIRTDTVIVGPFLIVDHDTIDVTAVARSLADAWDARTSMLGREADRIEAVIVTVTLEAELVKSGAAARLHPFEPFVTGRADFSRAAERIVSAVLTAELPADVRAWLGGASLEPLRSMEWTYRELAMATAEEVRRCFHDDADACRLALGLESAPDNRAVLSSGARATLLEHALDVGGAGSYARLYDDASDVAGRLENAAGVPLHALITGWRGAVQSGRPDVHAGLARAGIWTLLWLAALALLAMRSTRWRLG